MNRSTEQHRLAPTRWGRWALGALVALALLASACGGEEATASVASAADVQVEAPTADNTTDDDSDVDADSGTAVAVEDTGSSPELTDEELAIEFVGCMRDNGVDIDDPTVDSDGSIQLFNPGSGQANFADESFQEAFGECSELLEGATFFGARGGDATERNDQLLAMTQCLRDQGFDVDDPDASGGGFGGRGGIFGENFDPQDPANAEALNLCRDESGFVGGRP